MKYALGNMLNGAGGLNPDGLALDLQFAADKTLTARKGPTPVLTRGSAATQVGSTGLIEYAPENLLFPSELLTNSPTAVVLNRVTGDSVFSNPVFISETTSGTLHRVFTNVAAASSGVNSIGQFFFKQNGRQFIYFNGSNGAPSNTFDLSTGVFTNATGWTSQSLGEGWWKIITPVFQPSSNNPFWAFQLNTTNAVADSNYTGDTTKGVLFAGTQLERFSTARAYNPTTTAAFYGPRFDHDPVTLASRGLLIEESRTNLALRSGAIVSNAGWVTTEVISTIDGLGPDNNDAYRINETTSTSTHAFANTGGLGGVVSTSVVAGTIYTGSIFLKKVSGSVDWIQLSYPGIMGLVRANFNLHTGSVGSSAGLPAGTQPSMQAFGNGWYRCSVPISSASTTTTNNLIVGFTNNSDSTTIRPSYAGNAANAVLASLCQFEVGSFPTSYIPTTASSVVRSADVCSITGGAFTNMWNASEGTMFASGISRGYLAMANSGVNANQIAIFRNPLPLYMRFDVANSGTYTAQIAGPTILEASYNKTAGSYASNEARAAFNGSLGTPDSTVTIPSNLITLSIGSQSSGQAPHNGTIDSIRYYRKRLPNAKLQALTV